MEPSSSLPTMTQYLFAFSLLLVYAVVLASTDYYELLGVAKDADSRTIRKAFKQLAVTKHPDKNTDNPSAHGEFLKINRAYEVLKDPDLRKKYDQFGEEGLKDDHPSNRYQSWNFYQNQFGIYDNDEEIVTLSQAEFNNMVHGSGEIWFVNFYSPQCSHCHTLAPTWREMARDLEGVIRIGAVNCADDFYLCSQESIRSYPSLFMYPAKRQYSGEHSLEPLVTFALSFLSATSLELTKFNFESTIKSSKRKHLPWLITYCGDGGDCLSRTTCKKLGSIYADLVNIATIDCWRENKAICDDMGVEHGTFFYTAGEVMKGKGEVVTSLDFKEVSKVLLLSRLPDLMWLDSERFTKILADLKSENDIPWLVMFLDSDTHDPELRKLSAMLPDMNVGRIDCRRTNSIYTVCEKYYVHKFPTFMVFKQKGTHEYHYGRDNARDVAAFAKECARNGVAALGPDDFPDVINDGVNWFIDYFAPWCPPCMRLLPVFRRASLTDEVRVRFGTVDCALHKHLCTTQQIQSYPTTIFYNQTSPYHFKGQHDEESIITFIKDIISPPYVSFTEEIWDELVERKSDDTIWLVDFYAPWCRPCQQLQPEWRHLAKALKDHKTLRVGEVNCQEHSGLCNAQGVKSYPSIRLYPLGKKGVYNQFDGMRYAGAIRIWALSFLPSNVMALTPQYIDTHVLTSTDPWVIDFYAPWCGPCQQFAPEFNEVAEEFGDRVKFGKLDCNSFRGTCQSYGVQFLPSVRLYRGVTGARTTQRGDSGEQMQADRYGISFLLQQIFPRRDGVDGKTRDEL